MRSPCAMKSWLLVALVAGSAACATLPTGPSSLAATREVTAARSLIGEIDALVSGNRLRRLQDSFECDDGAVTMQATLFTDASGRPRKYVLEGGTGDSAHYIFYYYDQSGRLRLI